MHISSVGCTSRLTWYMWIDKTIITQKSHGMKGLIGGLPFGVWSKREIIGIKFCRATKLRYSPVLVPARVKMCSSCSVGRVTPGMMGSET